MIFAATLMACASWAEAPDERPAEPGEWGFRPAHASVVERTPPSFCWRPQKGARTYELQASRDATFERVDYVAEGVGWNVHCPPHAFDPGSWFWRFRYVARDGAASDWSSVRRFELPPGAPTFVLPVRDELLARIPAEHPRLFVRPEDLPGLRRAAGGEGRERFDRLVVHCDRLVAVPPSTVEPPLYEPGTKRGSDPWRAVWWGNRKATIAALDGASLLAFVGCVAGREDYSALARRLLLECARWDPHGATGYRYNDEAGMPYAYHFSRTYTFLHPLLTEEERELCRTVMQARGREMYAHLAPRHLWRPYSSHSNRAWHFLGEVGIAFHGELPEAGDWVWFAANVFANVYPVWSDADGGWHEGTAYWQSYLSRFTWWADVQRAALGLDAYALPFFSRAGDWALYLMPPGTRGGGFGDLNAGRTADGNRALMTTLARQARNPYWRGYVEALGGPDPGWGWIAFLRAAAVDVEPRSPEGLPTSRRFDGTGIAVLGSSLASAADNVEVIFKSSPFGSQSHGYEAQNSFLLYAFGERLLIRTGRRDSYGSRHQREWMWDTRSTNSVTVNGGGQVEHSARARGELTGFHTEPGLHWVEGEAAAAYGGALEGFRRGILFVEPDLIVIHDRLRAAEPSVFEWWLHAPTAFTDAARGVTVANGAAACRVRFVLPDDLSWTQTDRFDPPPRERVKLVEHHLTASTAEARREANLLTVIRPYRSGDAPPTEVDVEREAGTVRLRAALGSRTALVALTSEGDLSVEVQDAAGAPVATLDTARARD